MVKSFEGARGFAALIVALFHFKLIVTGPFTAVVTGWSLVRNGYLMVDLFFVLSGFLMAANYAQRLESKQAFRPFLLRRLGRLFPLLVFATVLYVLVQNADHFIRNQIVALDLAKLASGTAHLPYVLPTLAEILATLTMTHSLGLFDKLILNFASWSISVEFYTYILFAAVCFMLRGRARLFAFGLLALAASVLIAWLAIVPRDCRVQLHCLDITYDFGFFRSVAAFFLGALASSLSKHWRCSANLGQAGALSLLLLLFLLVDRFPCWISSVRRCLCCWCCRFARTRGCWRRCWAASHSRRLGATPIPST
ncbi:acyltransferase family protein [Rugamonas sp. CCM 8940]|uniref:acyltransferase family protein n=1 Tax=Rugamonas sp. CCM 8940 TaxID=2765359 RepID=UPI00360AD141